MNLICLSIHTHSGWVGAFSLAPSSFSTPHGVGTEWVRRACPGTRASGRRFQVPKAGGQSAASIAFNCVRTAGHPQYKPFAKCVKGVEKHPIEHTGIRCWLHYVLPERRDALGRYLVQGCGIWRRETHRTFIPCQMAHKPSSRSHTRPKFDPGLS